MQFESETFLFARWNTTAYRDNIDKNFQPDNYKRQAYTITSASEFFIMLEQLAFYLFDGAVLASDKAFMFACAMSDETAVRSKTYFRKLLNIVNV